MGPQRTQDFPITSFIVLVAKRSKPKISPDNVNREQSLSSCRFCVDFRLKIKDTQFQVCKN
ncbi:hypothetical protein MAR_004044 [Mya arenaria]|uniref:Uncharacterized protein n=1 Tax=Mya arenaria TaxID=6604 RepID=A0ABY7EZQ4_MYAAR|nr:hypothetical protein MAR_004044 [Mya arenaria]